MIKETSREHVNFGGARAVPRETGIGFVLIVLFGLTLRLYGLAFQDIRYGEAASYLTGTAGLVPLDPQFYGDTPPLYYHVIYLWTRLHESIWFARLFETLCGTAVIGVVYLFTLRFAEKKAALFAAFIQAASPFAIFHSREVGANAFAQLLVIVSLLSLERYMKTGNTRTALVALATQVLAAFTSYAALPLIPAMLTIVYINRNNQRGIWGEWLVLQGLFLVPLAFWLYAVFESRLVTAIENLSLLPHGGGLQTVMAVINMLVYGYFTKNISAWLLILPVAVLAVAGMADAPGRRLAIYFFLPFLLMVVLINGCVPPHCLFAFSPVLAVLAGAGFAVLSFASLRTIAAIWISAGFAASAAGYYSNNQPAAPPDIVRKEFSRAADFLRHRLYKGETLYHAGKSSTAPMAALFPGRWQHQWLAPDNRMPAISGPTAGLVAPSHYGEGPEFPAWTVFTSSGVLPFHDMEPAAVRYRIERSAAPAETALFKGIALARYLPYETGLLDRLEDESGGIHLLKNRETGEEFPSNYSSLRTEFSGTALRLRPDGDLEMNTSYQKAQVALTVVNGYPLPPEEEKGDNYFFAPDGYANSFCFKTALSPKQEAIVPLATTAPAGTYRFFARVKRTAQQAGLQAFAGDREMTAQPVVPPASETGWQWLSLGTVSYDGISPFSIHITSIDKQPAEAEFQSFFLIPLEGGKLYRKNFTLRKGELVHMSVPPNGLPLAAFLSDEARGELLVTSLAR